jgi:hypothetical protein
LLSAFTCLHWCVCALVQAGAKKRPPFSEMVTDVFDTVPDLLQEQYAELTAHMAKYPGVYDLDKGH